MIFHKREIQKNSHEKTRFEKILMKRKKFEMIFHKKEIQKDSHEKTRFEKIPMKRKKLKKILMKRRGLQRFSLKEKNLK